MLKPYVFECLTRFGNTIISESTFDHYGSEILLEELRKNGFDCKIRESSLTGSRIIIIELN